MLKLRIITAVVLLSVLLPLLFQQNPSPFVGFALLIISAGAWEWARLNAVNGPVAVFYGVSFAGSLAFVWLFLGIEVPPYFWWFSAGLWLLVIPWLLVRGVDHWQKIPRWLRLSAGFSALVFAWIAMAQARAFGTNFLLSIFSLVWMADISAYFGGKKFGRHKLAPSISPGKSWEGVFAGLLGVLLLSALWIWADSHTSTEFPSFYTELFIRHPIGCWVVFSSLAAVSVTGDLIESLVKRSVGFKDSSNLLPGHGGILDRIDALLPVLPLTIWCLNL